MSHSTTTPDRRTDQAMRDTFPASDPAADRNLKGARAVPVEEMLNAEAAPVADSHAITRDYADAESAKLAMESLVRDVPIDPRHAQIVPGDPVRLHIQAPAQDATRIEQVLDRTGG